MELWKTIFYLLNNNLSYTHSRLFFFIRKVFISITMILTLFFLSSSERFLYISGAFFSSLFCYCFRKTLVPFSCFFLKLLFVFFIMFINHFYICLQKNYKKQLMVIDHFYICKNIYKKYFLQALKTSFKMWVILVFF